MSSTTRKLFIACLFAIAMAYVESSVVVYLRALYYPEGFNFPMKIMPARIYLIELGRELSTLIMLATVAWFAEKRFLRWFMMMSFVWGVWDIFYYLWLKIFLSWPQSLLTPDILFLIPVPWVGPVVAPVIVSIIFIFSALLWLTYHKCKIFQPKLIEVIMIIGGFILIFTSFVYDFFTINLLRTANPPFLWSVFFVGISFLIISGLKLWYRCKKL